MQPASSEPWLRLAQFELDQGNPQAALRAIGPALYLDPRSPTVQQTYLDASRAEAQRRADAAQARAKAKEKRKPSAGDGVQRRPQQRAAPPTACRSTSAKPASASTPRSVRRREEAQVVGARVQVRVERGRAGASAATDTRPW